MRRLVLLTVSLCSIALGQDSRYLIRSGSVVILKHATAGGLFKSGTKVTIPSSSGNFIGIFIWLNTTNPANQPTSCTDSRSHTYKQFNIVYGDPLISTNVATIMDFWYLNNAPTEITSIECTWTGDVTGQVEVYDLSGTDPTNPVANADGSWWIDLTTSMASTTPAYAFATTTGGMGLFGIVAGTTVSSISSGYSIDAGQGTDIAFAHSTSKITSKHVLKPTWTLSGNTTFSYAGIYIKSASGQQPEKGEGNWNICISSTICLSADGAYRNGGPTKQGDVIIVSAYWDGSSSLLTGVTDGINTYSPVSAVKIGTHLNGVMYCTRSAGGIINPQLNFSSAPPHSAIVEGRVRGLATTSASSCSSIIDDHKENDQTSPGTGQNVVTTTAMTLSRAGDFLYGSTMELQDQNVVATEGVKSNEYGNQYPGATGNATGVGAYTMVFNTTPTAVTFQTFSNFEFVSLGVAFK